MPSCLFILGEFLAEFPFMGSYGILAAFGGLGMIAFGVVFLLEAWGFWLAIITGIIGVALDIISIFMGMIPSIIGLIIGAVILY